MVVAAAVLLTLLLLGHRVLPNRVGHLGSLVETFLPWLGTAVPVLLFCALAGRSPRAVLAVLVPAVVWTTMFGGMLAGAGTGPATPGELKVLQHNVSDENRDPAGTARALVQAGPDLIALEELTPAALPAYQEVFARGLPHRAVFGSVGLWSRYPLTGAVPLDIRPSGLADADWQRALRATVHAPEGDIAVYVAHLPSIRFGVRGLGADRRDDSARRLGRMLDGEPLGRVVLSGDLNSTLDDRGLGPLTSRLTAARSGFGFTWPAARPLARIDQVLCRGLHPVSTAALPATGSDHLPVIARLRW
ncbi:endonuclease/exonuclease/phosphatase family protein [Kitasatospora indigofera]|uniref:endonuclease/exonuclease/phosphatase family protein n=1 Tax=Kitasatospora indigofera TaxID=67307 RepID=UPI003679B40B